MHPICNIKSASRTQTIMNGVAVGSVAAASQSSLLLKPSKFGFRTLAPPSASLPRLHQPSNLLFSSPNLKLRTSIFAAKVVSSYSEATSSLPSTIITDSVDLSAEGIEIEIDTGGGGNDGSKDFGGGGGGGGGGGDGGGGKNEGEGGSPDESGSEKKMALSMSQKLTLGYAALVGIGGAMGYMKSGSQKSLLAGGISASVLYYVFTQLPANPVYASSIGLGISAALLGVMGSRFLKSKKIFPAGVVSLMSFIMTGGYLHGILRSMH
ncbi:PROTEIN FATTY ACID EXPORT 2 CHLOROPLASTIC [Salix koriyanagi]|uniref:PROTEIN FATTY ACID EXPORT 2 CHLOROPLASTIC n=1 Tax=Salix koriyanagi TaxID=2511006 RepID=A0A9Q0VBW0_9ROSI|nr:PROTEIN FATTY ACID EXPORT 2 CHLOROPLASTIC [Salix koriyanagi]